MNNPFIRLHLVSLGFAFFTTCKKTAYNLYIGVWKPNATK